jgi:hypothetical protein
MAITQKRSTPMRKTVSSDPDGISVDFGLRT